MKRAIAVLLAVAIVSAFAMPVFAGDSMTGYPVNVTAFPTITGLETKFGFGSNNLSLGTASMAVYFPTGDDTKLRFAVAYGATQLIGAYDSYSANSFGNARNSSGTVTVKYFDWSPSSGWGSLTTNSYSAAGYSHLGTTDRLVYSTNNVPYMNSSWAPSATSFAFLGNQVDYGTLARINPEMLDLLWGQESFFIKIYNYVTVLPDLTAGVFNDIIGAVETAVNTVGSVVTSIYDTIVNVASSIGSAIGTTVSNIYTKISNVATSLGSGIATLVDNIKTNVTNTYNKAVDIVNSIGSAIGSNVSSIVTKVTDLWNNGVSILNAITGDVKDALVYLWDHAVQAAEDTVLMIAIPVNIGVWFFTSVKEIGLALLYWVNTVTGAFPPIPATMITIDLILAVLALVVPAIMKFFQVIGKIGLLFA